MTLPCRGCIVFPMCRTVYLKEHKRQKNFYAESDVYSRKMTKFRAIGQLLSKKPCNDLNTYVGYSNGSLITKRIFEFHQFSSLLSQDIS